MDKNKQHRGENADGESRQVDPIVMPVCPFCKIEMKLSTIQTGNGCGEYFEEIVWDCDCMDYELEKQFKLINKKA